MEQNLKVYNKFDKEVNVLHFQGKNLQQFTNTASLIYELSILTPLENIQKEYTDKFKEQEEKYNKLDKLYDDCENEKLAAQADYDSLKEKYESLKINAEANEEVARKYDDLYEEYETLKSKESADKELLKFNKDDINNLCDTILDFFKDKNLNKE